MDQIIPIVTDNGPGDGGKGGVVHKLASHYRAHTIIKVGGGQGCHGVKTASGHSFAFSQFGCGTFDGAETFVSRNFVFRPNELLNEADALRYAHGVTNALDLITVDEGALCATPFHRLASQLRELARKDRPRGTVGSGVGNAVADSWVHPELAIYARELSSPGLRDKLEAIRRQKLADLAALIEANDFLDSDRVAVENIVARLQDETYVAWVAKRFKEMADSVRIVPADYLGSEILSREGCAVVEASHGILTDRYYGFHPHTSKLRTLPSRTVEMLREAGYTGRVVKLGIFRAYGIRHGAGPFVTEDPAMLDSLLPGSSKDENRYQGRVRVGALDTVALRYAIEACGGPSEVDALAVTWFDQIKVRGSWPICESYQHADDPELFESTSRIRVHRGEDDAQLARQQRLGEALNRCRPNVTSLPLPEGATNDELARFCADTVGEKLGVPVRMVSLGPTEDDKILL